MKPVGIYLNRLFEDRKLSNDLFIYHYTNTKLSKINKQGILSLYGLYHKDPAAFEKAIQGYLPRIKAKIGKKDEYSIEDIDKFFKSRGLDIKSIFFSFWEIIPGLHKERDEFIKNANLIKINIKKLKSTWKYNLINASKVTTLPFNQIKKYCEMDSEKFQKKQGGKFIFTNIPHLAVIPPDGVIPKNFF
jgi:hypothetical protein